MTFAVEKEEWISRGHVILCCCVNVMCGDERIVEFKWAGYFVYKSFTEEISEFQRDISSCVGGIGKNGCQVETSSCANVMCDWA